jgi:hypothetical protein
MAARAPPASRPTLGLPLLLLVAVVLGVAAAILVNPITTGPPPSPTEPTTGAWVADVFAVGILLFFFGVIGFHIIRVLTEGRMRFPGRALSVLVVVLLLLGAFVLLSHLAPVHPIPGSPQNRSSGNGSGAPPNTPGGPGNPLGPVSGGPISAASWLTWSVLGGIVLAVAIGLLLLWFYWPRSLPPERNRGSADRARAARLRGDLERSLRALEEDPEADPRLVIRALYHRLLLSAAPHLGRWEVETPREIDRRLEAEFGISAEPARELTRLFEEAQYSTHPLDRAAAERARAALRALLADLDRYLAHRAPADVIADLRPGGRLGSEGPE